MQPCVMLPIALPRRITQGCIIYPCVMTISSHLYVQPKLGTSAQLDYSSVTRPSLPREGLACETTSKTPSYKCLVGYVVTLATSGDL